MIWILKHIMALYVYEKDYVGDYLGSGVSEYLEN